MSKASVIALILALLLLAAVLVMSDQRRQSEYDSAMTAITNRQLELIVAQTPTFVSISTVTPTP